MFLCPCVKFAKNGSEDCFRRKTDWFLKLKGQRSINYTMNDLENKIMVLIVIAATYQDFQLVEVKTQQSFVTHEISRLTT